MRPVAGNVRLGYAFVEELRPVWFRERSCESIVTSIDRMREAAVKAASGATLDVKSGAGGLRDVEFLVQGLQLMCGRSKPHILEGNTLSALELLAEANLLPAKAVSESKKDYLFLRRVEHYLQIMEDRQIHAVPRDKKELNALAKRVLGTDSDEDQFMAALKACLSRVRNRYTEYLVQKAKTP
jgi:glutamate-ammonia-ligase adenylyltransferase